MDAMSATRSGDRPDNPDAGSWATETLPLSVRKELLERELSKLGFRKGGAHGGASGHESSGSQQQSDAGGSHPHADADSAGGHAD
jgi:hypothetical protein